MDAVSILVNVTTLVNTCVQIYKGIESVRNGSEDREKMLSEMRLLHNALHSLKGMVDLAHGDEAWMQPIQELNEKDGVFAKLYSALEQLMSKLGAEAPKRGEHARTSVEKPESLRRRIRNGFKWSLSTQDTQDILQRIESLKNTVALALGQSNLILAAKTGESVSALKKDKDEQRLQEIIEWLSPLNFPRIQEDKRGEFDTGNWFFQLGEFQNWASGKEPVIWCHGIPGAGKTTLASTTVDKLRKLHQGQRVAVLCAFYKYDEPDTQSSDLLLASLLKQTLQVSANLLPEIEAIYDQYRKKQSRPTTLEVCTLLQLVVNQFDKTFLVLDGLDEIKSASDRKLLLDHLQALDGEICLMMTSRRYDDITSQFGRSLTLGYQCDDCKVRLSRVYYFCDKCHADKCPSCYGLGEACRETGHLVRKNACGSVKITAHPEDLESYILQRIKSADQLRKWVSNRKGLQDEILCTVKDKAKDMFLLARFYMVELEKQMTVKQVLNTLGKLPVELDENYDQAMHRIEELKNPLVQMVKELLMWVACAKRPLSTAELEHALAIDPDIEEIDEDDVTDITALASKCAGLIEIDDAKYVHLHHETVEHYFRRNLERWFPGGESLIADKCLSYLRMTAFSQGACSGATEEADFEDRCIRYPFLPYASVFWGHHATQRVSSAEDRIPLKQGDKRSMTKVRPNERPSIMPSSMKFFRSKGNLESAIQAMWHYESRWDAKKDAGALHLAAWFGLHLQVAELLSKGADVNAKDCLGTTPLMYASARGNREVSEVLLHSNADTSPLCHRGETAFHRASFIGRPKIVRQILEYSDVSINILCKRRLNRSALMLAIVKGHVDVIKVLLAKQSIDVNVESQDKQTALSLAAALGREEFVRLLLERAEIQIDHQDSTGYTALSQAGEAGNTSIVNLLMDHAANPNLRDIFGGTSLLRAVDQGKPRVVSIMTHRGADHTIRDFRGRTVLHGAATNGRPHILRILLRDKHNKLGVDVQGEAGETPLHDAVRCGKAPCVEVLLRLGARTDVLDNENRTPVDIAMAENQLEILEIIERARESKTPSRVHSQLILDTQTPNYQEPSDINPASQASANHVRLFYKAVEHDDGRDLEALLASSPEERKQLLDARDADSGASALHTAVRRGNLYIIEVLLKAGANPDAADHYGYAALHAAARDNSVDIVESLLDHGADVNVRNSIERTPLKTAALHAAREAALVLVERGAKVQEDSPHVQTLLKWASELGRMEVIRQLVPLGAAFMLKGSDGRSPYEIAKEEGHEEIAQLLLKATYDFGKDGQKGL